MVSGADPEPGDGGSLLIFDRGDVEVYGGKQQERGLPP